MIGWASMSITERDQATSALIDVSKQILEALRVTSDSHEWLGLYAANQIITSEIDRSLGRSE